MGGIDMFGRRHSLGAPPSWWGGSEGWQTVNTQASAWLSHYLRSNALQSPTQCIPYFARCMCPGIVPGTARYLVHSGAAAVAAATAAGGHMVPTCSGAFKATLVEFIEGAMANNSGQLQS